MKSIIVKHSHLELPEYILGDCPKLEKSLSYWDPNLYKYIPAGYEYDLENEILYVPRGLDINFVAKLTGRKLEVKKDENKPAVANIKLLSKPRDDNQVKGINFLVGLEEFSDTANYSQKVLILPPGTGKTFISIASFSMLREKAIVITHLNRISLQWIESLKKFTQITDDDIYIFEGSKSITKLLEEYKKNKVIPYKLFFANHATILSYGDRYGWDKVNELFEIIKVGIKIFDEAHLNFANILRIDFHTNVKKTFYLTATFRRTDQKVQKVFDIAFKNVRKYGTELKVDRKHINYVINYFNSKPPTALKYSFHGNRGFKIHPYSNYLVENEIFYNALYKLLDQFTTFEGSVLILVASIEGCNLVKSYVQNRYPDENVTVLHSKVDKDKRELAMEGSIIISTIQSFGTGVDLRGLRFCINTIPYSSTVTADQLSGRLREYDSESYSIYVDMIDKGFVEIESMRKRRHKVLADKCNSISVLNS